MRVPIRPVVLALVLAPALVLAGSTSGAAQEAGHPLDELTPAEHWTLYETLRAHERVDESASYLYAGLEEPPKEEVLAWEPGASFGRRATVHFVQDHVGYEAVVDVAREEVVELREATDRQYMAGPADHEALSGLKEHPEMRAAFEARGIGDLDKVQCSVWADGYFGTPQERGRRLGWVRCLNQKRQVSGLGVPVPNLAAVVDRQTGEVLRVMDDGPIEGTPPSIGEHHPEVVGKTREPLPPMSISQPEGPGYELDGQRVSWAGWRFHFRTDQRRGLVLSRVGYEDDGGLRSVLYQASLSALFVPYHDPDTTWSRQAYFDLGTYPREFGGVSSAMEPGRDCPAYADFFDTWVIQADGSPEERQRVACLFERLPGEPAWRHTRDGGVVESRSRRELVLRMVMGAGNYDYLFDWIFQQDGKIRVNLAATGIDQMKAVAARSASEDPDGSISQYGRFVAPHLVAVNHSHIFNFRFDFDIDGRDNSLLVDRLVTERLPEESARRSVWRVESEVARREDDAMRTSTLSEPEYWRIVNPSRTGPQGYPRGYLIEGHGVKTLMSPDDYLQRRAGFTEHTLWATPMDPDEIYAAGDYTTSSVAGQGLPEWTSENRSIENTDLVVWYTIGFHHAPLPEDWPVLPLEMHGFQLVPAGFFDRNPALDLPH